MNSSEFLSKVLSFINRKAWFLSNLTKYFHKDSCDVREDSLTLPSKNSSNVIVVSLFLLLSLILINEYIIDVKFNKVRELFIQEVFKKNVNTSQAGIISKEIFHEYASKKFSTLKKNLDKQSIAVLDYALNCMEYNQFLRNTIFEPKPIAFPEYQYCHEKNWEIEQKSIQKKYSLYEEDFAPEVFYFHHGLRFANEKILKYIKSRDIIDCGAFVGDSLLVLRNYTDKTVYCYEFAPKNVEQFHNVMNANGMAVLRTVIEET